MHVLWLLLMMIIMIMMYLKMNFYYSECSRIETAEVISESGHAKLCTVSSFYLCNKLRGSHRGLCKVAI